MEPWMNDVMYGALGGVLGYVVCSASLALRWYWINRRRVND